MANKELIMDEELFEDLMQKPYRAWIDHYLKTTDLPEMEQELGEFIGQLPDAVYEEMPSFMDAAMRFLVGQPRSWDLPGSKVASIIAALADEKIPAVADFSGNEQDSLYGALFDVVTLFLSVRSAESEELRQITGVTASPRRT
ncbi:MAG: hypothetical protein ACYC5X_01880 [Syntrophales bacterium]